jgi:hypothetical protein
VNALTTDTVILKGLNINGAGNGQQGIRFLRGRALKVYDTEIFGFVQNGIDFEPSNANAELVVANSEIHDNGGNGILVAPTSTGSAKASVRRNDIDDNACGLAATNHPPSTTFTVNCGTQTAGVGGAATINAFHNAFSNHDGTGGAGVFTNGQSSLIRIGDNEVTGNATGLRILDQGGGGASGIFSAGDNYVNGNTANGAPTGTIPKS